MKKNKGKMFKNLAIFLAIILLTFYIIFKDQDMSQFVNILSNIDLKFIFIGIGCMMVYFICDTLNIGRMLKTLGEKSNFFHNLKYSLIGFFFSSVTPAASGGQPMQIYYMNKNNISVANSTLTFLINLSCMQIVTISLALISLIFNYEYMNAVLISCFILGIFLNLMALALLIISITSKKMTNGLIKFVVKILKFFKVKNLEQKKESIENELNKYQSSAGYIKSNKGIIFKNLITTYIQFIFYYAISYFVYRSFGLNSCNILQIISMQSVLFATVSGIPSPGAVGVSEGGFLEIFKSVYSTEQISSAMLLSRGINFYLFVIISAVIVLICTIQDKKDEKNNIVKE